MQIGAIWLVSARGLVSLVFYYWFLGPIRPTGARFVYDCSCIRGLSHDSNFARHCNLNPSKRTSDSHSYFNVILKFLFFYFITKLSIIVWIIKLKFWFKFKFAVYPFTLYCKNFCNCALLYCKKCCNQIRSYRFLL